MVPGNNVAAGIQADEKKNQGCDESPRPKEVNSLECGSGGVLDWDVDREKYYDGGDEGKWDSKRVSDISQSFKRHAILRNKQVDRS